MGRVIEYSSDAMIRELENTLEKVNILRYNQEYRSALGEAFIDKLSQWEKDIARCRKNPFTIAVVGNFKKGKSTLINALMGEETATTDVTTETVTLNRISYGPHSNTAILADGRSVKLNDSELKRENLEAVISEIGEPIQRLELQRPCPLLEKVAIIDTPGIGDSMKDFMEIVRDSLLQADAVIYVYDVQYPLSRSEQLFLKTTVLPQKHTSLFLVGNYGDILKTEDNYRRMRQLLQERVGMLLPDTEIHMVSALDEFCRQTGEEYPENELTSVLRANFDGLRKQIQELIDLRMEYVVPDRMQRLAASMTYEMGTELAAIEKGLSLDLDSIEQSKKEAKQETEELMKRYQEAKEEISSAIAGMKTEANRWMGEFLNRMSEETGRLHTASEEDLKRYYEFYCIDLLQEAMETCVKTHEEQLLDRMDHIAGDVAEKLAAEMTVEKNYFFRINLDNRIWTKGDTVGFVASRVAPQNYMMLFGSFVLDGITGAVRENTKKNSVPALVEQITGKLPALAGEVSRSIASVYQDMNEQAQRFLSDYFTEQIERQEHLQEQMLLAAGRSEEDKKAVKDAAGIARGILEEVREYAEERSEQNS